MAFFYEIFPVLLFFIAFKWYGIYTATTVGIVVTTVQVILYRLYMRKWDNKQLVTLLIFVIFGGMTLYFHNPIFVKWKPTVVFWVFATAILISHFFMKKTIIQYLMENVINEKGSLPNKIWRAVNIYWALFFITMGMINLYIAYNYDIDTWVNFKFYGITSALLMFSVFQAVYLMRHIISVPNDKQHK